MDYVTFDKLCKENGTTATAIALKLGLSKGNTSSWKKGGNPSADILIKIADELNCTVDILLGRKFHSPKLGDDESVLIENFSKLGEKDKGKVLERAELLAELAAERAAEQAKKEEEPAQSSTDERPTPQKPLPFPTEPEQDEEDNCYIDICSFPANAGTGVYIEDSGIKPLQIVHTDIADRANYAIRVSGDSMMPEYCDGDIVLVETCRSVAIGEIGVFMVDGDAYIKKYGGDRLISFNPKYKDMLLKKYESSFCRGRVLGIAEVVE